MLARLWHAWQARVQLFSKTDIEPNRSFFDGRLQLPACSPGNHPGQAPLAPYQGLSHYWHAYDSGGHLDYAGFIRHFAKARGLPLESVLDMACGTGTQTARLAEFVPQVVGFDCSEHMLDQARSNLVRFADVRFHLASFCNFQLEQTFDFIICAGNSLNYARHTADLHDVFRSVARHLRPHGLFCFDTSTSFEMAISSRLYLHCRANDEWFAMRFEYSPKLRKEVATILLPMGLEHHHRIPIDLSDVEHAAVGSGLALDHCFANKILHKLRAVAPSIFVMRKSRA